MDYLLSVESARESLARHILGKYLGILFSDIKSIGDTEYKNIFSVFEDGASDPCFIVALETNLREKQEGRERHQIGVFSRDGHVDLGDFDDWADEDKFVYRAMEIVEYCLPDAWEQGQIWRVQFLHPSEVEFFRQPAGASLGSLIRTHVDLNSLPERLTARSVIEPESELEALPKHLRSKSYDDKELVLPYKEALEAAEYLEEHGWSFVKWDGWVLMPDGSVRGGKLQGTVPFSGERGESWAFCRRTMKEDQDIFDREPNPDGETLLFCITAWLS